MDSNDHEIDPDLLVLITQRREEADRKAAPLLMRQMAEDDLINEGRIDPAKGEYLAAFGLGEDGNFVCEIRQTPTTS